MERRSSPDLRLVLLAVAGICVAGVLVLRLWLKWVGPLPGDRWAQAQIDGGAVGVQPWIDLGTFFSVIGGPPVALVSGVVALWFAWRAGGVRAAGFVALACAGVFVNMLLKLISGPTPLLLEKFVGNASPGLNYPSGHTVYGVVMFGSLAWLAWSRGRRDVAAVLVGLSLAMGPARVLADAHFVSDVIGGYFAGIAWLLCAALLTGAGGAAPSLQIGRGFARPGA